MYWSFDWSVSVPLARLRKQSQNDSISLNVEEIEAFLRRFVALQAGRLRSSLKQISPKIRVIW